MDRFLLVNFFLHLPASQVTQACNMCQENITHTDNWSLGGFTPAWRVGENKRSKQPKVFHKVKYRNLKENLTAYSKL